MQVPEAVCLPSLTYHEAWELSYFGANVLHPRTTLPAMKYNIPISIRNFFHLSAPGIKWRSSLVGTGQHSSCLMPSPCCTAPHLDIHHLLFCTEVLALLTA
jgi:hypothetical protein